MNLISLDVGCGTHLQRGCIGMDKRDLPGVEIVHDAEEFPWPLYDNACELVFCIHLIEHIKPWLQFNFINEVWRVTQSGGVLFLVTPYGGSNRWHKDPTHCASWTELTPKYFIEGAEEYKIYQPKPWELISSTWLPTGDLEVRMRTIKS